MHKMTMKSQGFRMVKIFLPISIGVIVADHLVKWIIKKTMSLNETIHVIDDLLTISYIRNSGIAFGLFDGSPSPLKVPVLILVSFIALGIILYIFLTLPKDVKCAGLSMGLIFGGALGNIIDRIFMGEVVDFVDIDFPNIIIPALNIRMTRWPTFNVADSCVLVGIIMLLIIIIKLGSQPGEEGG